MDGKGARKGGGPGGKQVTSLRGEIVCSSALQTSSANQNKKNNTE